MQNLCKFWITREKMQKGTSPNFLHHKTRRKKRLGRKNTITTSTLLPAEAETETTTTTSPLGSPLRCPQPPSQLKMKAQTLPWTNLWRRPAAWRARPARGWFAHQRRQVSQFHSWLHQSKCIIKSDVGTVCLSALVLATWFIAYLKFPAKLINLVLAVEVRTTNSFQDKEIQWRKWIYLYVWVELLYKYHRHFHIATKHR